MVAKAVGLLVQVGESLKSHVAERLAKDKSKLLSRLRWLQATTGRKVAGNF